MSKKTTAKKAAPTLPGTSKYRRTATTAGEDLPALKKIAKEIKEQVLNVEDFIVLVSPHTGDKGATLTKVMNEDLTTFRRMATKVYDTMTKDASDVMANTQIELGQLYAEKQRYLVDNMIRALETIKDYVPDFDFQRYFNDPEGYLCNLFHLADMPDLEEIELAKRQLAYHRLQWLQSERERLQTENTKLEERLAELKQVKRKQIIESIAKENEAEVKKNELEQQQEQMQSELEELADELHDTIVTEEKKSMDTRKENKIKILAKKQKPSVVAGTQPEDWNVQTAAQYNRAQVQGETYEQLSQAGSAGSLTKIPGAPPARGSRRVSSKSSITRRVKKPIPIDKRPAWLDVNLDEFNAGGGMPSDTASPVAPPQRAAPPSQAAPPRSPSRAQPRAPSQAPCRGRHVAGPRDSWGGFR